MRYPLRDTATSGCFRGSSLARSSLRVRMNYLLSRGMMMSVNDTKCAVNLPVNAMAQGIPGTKSGATLGSGQYQDAVAPVSRVQNYQDILCH
jgi:hypothetical protein